MIVQYVPWEGFLDIVNAQNDSPDYQEILYRGHSSSSYELTPTLGRFLSKEQTSMSAQKYHEIIQCVLKDGIGGIESNSLPEKSPFKIGAFTGNDIHKAEMEKTFMMMIQLRHLGFPSPILDWTRDHHIAAFFAFSNEIANECAIYCLKQPKALEIKIREFEIFEPQICILPHNTTNEPLRHKQQKATYTIIAYNEKSEYERSNLNALFHLSSIERLCHKKPLTIFELEKYIITDSKKMRINILKELYSNNISNETLYCTTHIDENTRLKDIAIRQLLLQ